VHVKHCTIVVDVKVMIAFLVLVLSVSVKLMQYAFFISEC